MIDITLIREKPEWVKEQILKLNDPDGAGARRCHRRAGQSSAAPC